MTLTSWFWIRSRMTMLARAAFRRSERGASLVEYALLVALIAVVCLVAVQFVGAQASTKFSNIGSNLS